VAFRATVLGKGVYDTPTLFPRPFCHDTTLQHCRLLNVTKCVMRWSLLGHARPARGRG
jgi:hypothetical protein